MPKTGFELCDDWLELVPDNNRLDGVNPFSRYLMIVVRSFKE